MSTVKVSQEHNLEPDELHSRIEEIASELGSRFDLKAEWQDDQTVNFKRSGLSGTLSLGADKVDVQMKLGLLMGSFKQAITRELQAQMKKRLT